MKNPYLHFQTKIDQTTVKPSEDLPLKVFKVLPEECDQPLTYEQLKKIMNAEINAIKKLIVNIRQKTANNRQLLTLFNERVTLTPCLLGEVKRQFNVQKELYDGLTESVQDLKEMFLRIERDYTRYQSPDAMVHMSCFDDAIDSLYNQAKSSILAATKDVLHVTNYFEWLKKLAQEFRRHAFFSVPYLPMPIDEEVCEEQSGCSIS